ncbi:MAG: hypothetical protein NUV44_00450 [Candidatus Scalindua sp.]|nr:hypothetical protein [Candidatus Scalindua sp.]
MMEYLAFRGNKYLSVTIFQLSLIDKLLLLFVKQHSGVLSSLPPGRSVKTGRLAQPTMTRLDGNINEAKERASGN